MPGQSEILQKYHGINLENVVERLSAKTVQIVRKLNKVPKKLRKYTNFFESVRFPPDGAYWPIQVLSVSEVSQRCPQMFFTSKAQLETLLSKKY